MSLPAICVSKSNSAGVEWFDPWYTWYHSHVHSHEEAGWIELGWCRINAARLWFHYLFIRQSADDIILKSSTHHQPTGNATLFQRCNVVIVVVVVDALVRIGQVEVFASKQCIESGYFLSYSYREWISRMILVDHCYGSLLGIYFNLHSYYSTTYFL